MQTDIDIDNDPIRSLRFSPNDATGVYIYSPADHRPIGVLFWHPYYRRRMTTAARVGWVIELWSVRMEGEPLEWWLEREDEVRDHVRGMLVSQFTRHPDLVRITEHVRKAWGSTVTPDRFSAPLRECLI
jgi:hypothetical protein